jgi:hypothetical protein
MNFEGLLEKVKTFKDDYNTKELSLDMRGMATLLMAGAMDSLFDKPLSTQMRIEAVGQLKKAMGSKSELASSKKDEMGIADIDNELTRNVWLSKSNPLHKFSLSSFYSSALNSMGFQKCADSGISFTSDQTDIMESFSSMFTDKLFDRYSNQNCRRECAIVAVFKDKSIMTCKNGSKKMNLTFFDGTTEMSLTSWSNRRTGEFEKGLLMRTQEKGVPLLVIGRPGKYMGRSQFTIQAVLALGF